MDIDAAGEFHDWEVLQQMPDSNLPSSPASAEVPNNFEEIGANSEGIIQSDYFSIERAISVGADVIEEGSEVSSDNPSWIDPALEAPYSQRKDSGDFWSDSGSEKSDYKKFGEFDVKNEKFQMGHEGIEEIGGESEKFWSDSGGIGGNSIKVEGFTEKNIVDEGERGNRGDECEGRIEEEQENKAIGKVDIKEKKGEDGTMKKRSVVWWKLPMEFLKYCLFRMSPVWTFSVAAAVMGFVILGRRLYRMKRKTRSLELKVTVDDKKISQVMSRAARLNEAFSVVKRVPVIRPALPAAGVTPWPVMSLR